MSGAKAAFLYFSRPPTLILRPYCSAMLAPPTSRADEAIISLLSGQCQECLTRSASARISRPVIVARFLLILGPPPIELSPCRRFSSRRRCARRGRLMPRPSPRRAESAIGRGLIFREVSQLTTTACSRPLPAMAHSRAAQGLYGHRDTSPIFLCCGARFFLYFGAAGMIARLFTVTTIFSSTASRMPRAFTTPPRLFITPSLRSRRRRRHWLILPRLLSRAFFRRQVAHEAKMSRAPTSKKMPSTTPLHRGDGFLERRLSPATFWVIGARPHELRSGRYKLSLPAAQRRACESAAFRHAISSCHAIKGRGKTVIYLR